MGTPAFALPSLRHLVQSRHAVVGVVTAPDRPRGRGQKLQPTPVKAEAQRLGIGPILQPTSLRDPEFLHQLKALQADLFVVVAFRILPEAVFTMPPKGTINVHPSLLPRYRGPAPIPWTIINGDRVTGVSIIFIQKEVDAGNIILQQEVPVLEDETAGSLHDRLAEIGARLLVEAVDRLEAGPVPVKKQDERLATRAPKLTPEMTFIRFDQPAEQVKNWIHGLSPLPGARTWWNGKLIKLYRAQVASNQAARAAPGTILEVDEEGILVACAPGALRLTELQLEGRKRLPAKEFLLGAAIRPGDRFTPAKTTD
ncbi:MAG: methionyl-tRNA formyltransferase [Calditrichaeota bacterium]|nr:MAG: methionyl-tRNA formyltransferase [Calditrichota bacterium]